MVSVTEQATSAVRSLRAALVMLAALLTVVALLAMHSVAANEGPVAVGQETTQSANTSHGSEPSSVEHCPCPSDPDSTMSMADCTPVAALTSVVAAASLRTDWVVAAPRARHTSQDAGAVMCAQAPSLHALSISRT